MKTISAILLAFTLFANALSASDPGQDLADRMSRVPSIRIAPMNLEGGDQAIMLVRSYFDKVTGKPITLKMTSPNAAFEATELFSESSIERSRIPEVSDMRIYRITLKTPRYRFDSTDFDGLPAEFKFPALEIYRE